MLTPAERLRKVMLESPVKSLCLSSGGLSLQNCPRPVHSIGAKKTENMGKFRLTTPAVKR